MEISTGFQAHTHTNGKDGGEHHAASLLAALAYADLFDFPLTLDELARYQVGSKLSTAQVESLLSQGEGLGTAIVGEAGYFTLPGRRGIVRTRLTRERYSKSLWMRARAYSRWASKLPFVRMVSVTGALAVNNVGTVPDIDLMVVAQEGRVWLCRRALIMCVRVARLFGDDLCPNYIVSKSSLELRQRDFFTAHELAQMVPMFGHDVYRQLLEHNRWALDYLPQAFPRPNGHDSTESRRSLAQSGLEPILRNPMFDRWEKWELARLRAKLRLRLGPETEVVCSPSECKGHTGLHRAKVLRRYVERLLELSRSDQIEAPVRQSLTILSRNLHHDKTAE